MNFSISPPSHVFLSDAIRSAELDIDQMIFSPGIEGVSEERQTGAVYLDGIVFTAAHCSHL